MLRHTVARLGAIRAAHHSRAVLASLSLSLATPAASVSMRTPMRFARTPANPPPSQAPAAEVELTDALKKDLADMIARDRIVIFLTGTPHQPRCRFTAMLVDMLNQIGIKYSYVNILEDDEVCEGLKVYSNWPTYPQIYIDQELIGGYDICKTMMLNGQLVDLLKSKKLL